MRMSGRWVIGLAATVVALACLPPPATAEEAPTSLWFWRWSDGGEQRTRIVDVGGPVTGLPHLVATVVPARSGRRVQLQVLTDGRWRTEDSASTDRHGVAHLAVNPFCADGDWCRRAFDYRLVADGRTARLSIRFSSQ